MKIKWNKFLAFMIFIYALPIVYLFVTLGKFDKIGDDLTILIPFIFFILTIAGIIYYLNKHKKYNLEKRLKSNPYFINITEYCSILLGLALILIGISLAIISYRHNISTNDLALKIFMMIIPIPLGLWILIDIIRTKFSKQLN